MSTVIIGRRGSANIADEMRDGAAGRVEAAIAARWSYTRQCGLTDADRREAFIGDIVGDGDRLIAARLAQIFPNSREIVGRERQQLLKLIQRLCGAAKLVG